MVRTPGSHPGNRGSIPLGGTKDINNPLITTKICPLGRIMSNDGHFYYNKKLILVNILVVKSKSNTSPTF